MTVADVLDRLSSEDRPLVLAAMQAYAQEAVRLTLEQESPKIVRLGQVFGAQIVGQALGANVIVDA